jgi:RNA polymerase sigma-70 factor, ECF subfamily
MVFSIGLSVLKSREDAEDVVQDLFAHKMPALLESHPGLNPEEMGRMLAVITKNMCIDRYRRRRRFPETELDPEMIMVGGAGGTGTDTEAPEYGEATKDLEKLMEDLTPRHREVLTLKYIWDMTWEEVATRLGLSHAGARKRADQAKAVLIKKRQEPNTDDLGKGGGR